MSHTYARNNVHIVFSTKDRREAIGEDLRRNLWTYIGGICRRQGRATTFIC
jgi:REP element-mobilizing transposase RayT